MAVSAAQLFREIFDRLRKEREDYEAGRITYAELKRLQPWLGMYDNADFSKLFKSEKKPKP